MNDENLLRIAIDTAQVFQRLAICNISNHRVGAAVIASNEDKKESVFGGCNIEFATGQGFHAEQVALLTALSRGFKKVTDIIVTSVNEGKWEAMCGICRQYCMWVNPTMNVIILKPDGTLKFKEILDDTMKFAYRGGSRIL